MSFTLPGARRLGVASVATVTLSAALTLAVPLALTGAAHADPAISDSAMPGTVFFASGLNQTDVSMLHLDGTTSVLTSGLPSPAYGLAADSSGNVFVADGGSGVIEVAPDGTQTNVPFTGLSNAMRVTVDEDGDVYVVDVYNSYQVFELKADGTQVTVNTGATNPYAIALDHDGNLFVADRSAQAGVKKVAPDGTVTSIASMAQYPTGVAVDQEGDVFVADYVNNAVFETAVDGTQTTLRSQQNYGYPSDTQIATDQTGTVYGSTTSDGPFGGDGNTYWKIDPDGAFHVLDIDASNGYYNYQSPIAVSPSARLVQHATFTSAAPSDATVGGTIELAATGGGSGNPVTFTPDQASADVCAVKSHNDDTATVTLTGTGTCTVTTSQAGNRGYLAGLPAQQSFQVKADGSLAFTSYPSTARVGGTYQAAAAGASSGTVTFASGSPKTCSVSASGLVNFLHALPCSVVASQSADGSHQAAPDAVQTFRILRAKQKVHLTQVPKHSAKAGTSYRVKAAGSDSGTKVRVSVTGACSVNGKGKVTFLHAGTCHVQAVQSGNADYQVGRTSRAIKVTHKHHH